MAFDYGQPAELFMKKRKRDARSRQSCRFATAAEAIRFAVEDFPALRTLGTWMKVGKERFDGEAIHRLYEPDDRPAAPPIHKSQSHNGQVDGQG